LNIIHIIKPVLSIVIVRVKRIVSVLATMWTILAYLRCVCYLNVLHYHTRKSLPRWVFW